MIKLVLTKYGIDNNAYFTDGNTCYRLCVHEDGRFVVFKEGEEMCSVRDEEMVAFIDPDYYELMRRMIDMWLGELNGRDSGVMFRQDRDVLLNDLRFCRECIKEGPSKEGLHSGLFGIGLFLVGLPLMVWFMM